jgi:UDPglucose 6-dehydrogenase
MKVTVVGSGYVGLVSGACLSDMGNDVLCLDVDPKKIEALQSGRLPIYEPGLDRVVDRNIGAGRLRFTSDVQAAVSHGTMQFIAVGTPPDQDGSADVHHVLDAARNIGRYMTDYKVVVDKSTVPVGTAGKVRAAIAGELARRTVEAPFSVVANPEFLKEGAAVEDFMRPDRIIIGADDEQAIFLMKALYSPFQRSHGRLVLMDLRSAELTKYAANAMLATRISFMNEMARLAERLGADIESVRRGIGSDPRIGISFLYPGCGYGGSCLPKDVQALIRMADGAGQELDVLRAVEKANADQKRVLVDKVVQRFGDDLFGRRFAMWGLAFKPDTDDVREAPSVVIAGELMQRGAEIVAYDPAAMQQARRAFGNVPGIRYADRAMAALDGADALLVVTEWKEFRSPDFSAIKAALRQPVIFDGRNMYDPALPESAGIEYHGIGRFTAAVRAGRASIPPQ